MVLLDEARLMSISCAAGESLPLIAWATDRAPTDDKIVVAIVNEMVVISVITTLAFVKLVAWFVMVQ